MLDHYTTIVHEKKQLYLPSTLYFSHNIYLLLAKLLHITNINFPRVESTSTLNYLLFSAKKENYTARKTPSQYSPIIIYSPNTVLAMFLSSASNSSYEIVL